MRLSRRIPFIYLLNLLLVATFFSVTSYADTNSTSEEFTIKRKYMHDRVNDFYDRQDALDKQDRDRESAAGIKHKQREVEAATYEKARQDYAKQRKAKPPEDRANWQKELDARLKERERERLEFVKRRDEFNRESVKFDTIPPEEEMGLESESTP